MFTILLKFVIAGLLGGILGLERESKHKPLGLKTCIVISVASCLLTIVSIEVSQTSYVNNLIRVDPMRLAAQIVSGVGFLGAGVILHKSNDAISGLTTAAIVWAASGLGIAVGAGFYYESILGVALIFLGVKVIPYIMKKIGPSALREQGLKIVLYLEPTAQIRQIVDEVRKCGIRTKQMKVMGTENGHRLELNCTINECEDFVFTVYEKVITIEGVIRAQVEAM